MPYTKVVLAIDAPATPEAIKGETTVCVDQTISYSIDPVAGAISYAWTLPAGWSIITGQATTQITVRAGSTAGTISVVAYNQYGSSGSRELQVAFGSVPGKPGAILGAASICAGARATFSVDVVSSAKSYSWTIPASWTIVSGQGTRQLEVAVSGQGGFVAVVAANECGQSEQSRREVLVMNAISNNNIEGNQQICLGTIPAPLTGSMPTGADGTYVYLWESSTANASEGFAPAAGTNNMQHYTPGQLTTTTWFRRKVASGDCTHTSEPIKISGMPVPDKPAIEQVGNTELRTTIQGDYYEWRRDGVLLESHDQSIRLDVAGTYDVRVRQADCFSPYSDVLHVVLAEESTAPEVIMSLQPGRGQLIVSAKMPLSKVELKLFNLQGREVYRKNFQLLNEPVALELSQLPDGIYILSLQTPDLYLKQKVLLQR
ncbi:T9SS type A sorting domain-containing protein [uncultured Pontibacter sp.]|uniref:T9SS type A sorting domain-containing protein n=1 Tax=uncultured Pontibacter sp. TaxID=453356 RepID=UPI00263783FF|nr:T9SS type A sorting domain-containing protein [uncultured Pontibacter sp.]